MEGGGQEGLSRWLDQSRTGTCSFGDSGRPRGPTLGAGAGASSPMWHPRPSCCPRSLQGDSCVASQLPAPSFWSHAPGHLGYPPARLLASRPLTTPGNLFPNPKFSGPESNWLRHPPFPRTTTSPDLSCPEALGHTTGPSHPDPAHTRSSLWKGVCLTPTRSLGRVGPGLGTRQVLSICGTDNSLGVVRQARVWGRGSGGAAELRPKPSLRRQADHRDGDGEVGMEGQLHRQVSPRGLLAACGRPARGCLEAASWAALHTPPT